MKRWGALAVAVLASCGSDTGSPSAWKIDADVPGTEVYLGGQRLGVVPLRITKKQLADNGATLPQDASKSAIGPDGWGEGIYAGDEGDNEAKLMFRVPDEQAVKYLPVETPWGRRTRVMPTPDAAEGALRFKMAPAVDETGLKLGLSLPSSRVNVAEAYVTLEVSLEYTSDKYNKGERPELLVLLGTLRTPWNRRTKAVFKLDRDWSTWEPKRARKTTVSIRTPSVCEDYSVFAVFRLYEGETGEALSIKPVHSNSVLIRVR